MADSERHKSGGQTPPASLKKHFARLAKIAKALLGDDVDKVVMVGDGHPDDAYGVVSPKFGYYELTYRQLVGKLAGNTEKARQTFGEEFDGFLSHLMAEYPPGTDYQELLNHRPGALIRTLKELAERKTFKGSCGGCHE